MAEHVAETITKGQRLIVVGTLKQRSWDTEAGEKRYAYEVDVTDVGPSLRWATAKVNKATRNGGGLSGDRPDPWGTTPPANGSAPATAGASSRGGGFSDEPPF